jgi:hypothetical protein
MNEEKDSNAAIEWHVLLATLLKGVLTPYQITVLMDFKVMSESPRADILILRREHPVWTAEQRAHLPDGIRDAKAAHIMLEFKYTESLNERVVYKAIGYDVFYKESQRLKDKEVKTFIVSAKTPRQKTLEKALVILEDLNIHQIQYQVLQKGNPSCILLFLSNEDMREAVFKLTESGFTRVKGINPQPKHRRKRN